MTFFSSSSSSWEVQITKEQFYSFHNIDRKLFTRLTLHLGRDPGESAQVMAFWMWLEHSGKVTNFILKALDTLPNTLLHIMADESCMVLNVVQHEEFPTALESNIMPQDIPILQGMTKSGVTLKFFHQNRISIIRGLATFYNDVCLRAFEDLYTTAVHYQKKTIDPRTTGIGLQPEPQNYARRVVQVNKYYNPFFVGAATFDAPVETIGPLPPPIDETVLKLNSVDPHLPTLDPCVAVMASSTRAAQSPPEYLRRGFAASSTRAAQSPPEYLCRGFASSSIGAAQSAPPEYLRHGFANAYDIEAQHDILNNEMANMLSCLHLYDDIKGKGDTSDGVRGDLVEEEVPADDRTIFLTFSKGYPISQKEVREFFTRKYGDIFDAVHMQEVPVEDQQPLYARLIVRYASFIPMVLEGQAKAKFAINGKHVWARKYVKKNVIGEQSSPKGATSTQS